MRNFITKSDNYGLVGKTGRRLLSSTALTAAGLVCLTTTTLAGTVEQNEVWQFTPGTDVNENMLGNGHVQFSDTGSGRIIGNLVKEDICTTCEVNLNAGLTVATGVESGAMQILGKLTSTGDVYVYDVNGVLFGNASVVDVVGKAGFIAGQANEIQITDTGIKHDINVTAGGKIDIQAGARINVGQAGMAAFIGETVSNAGIVNAKMGKVVLASGERVTLDMTGGLFEVAVDGNSSDAYIENTGQIIAEGGDVFVTASAAKDAVDNVINMDGVIDVSSATMKGGKIVLSGGKSGKVSVSGTAKATGTDGGDIEVTGEFVSASGNAVLDVSGIGDGGSIKFGGDLQGSGDTPTSKFAFVGQNAILRANSEEDGNGGEVIVWSDKATWFHGKAEAKGGANSGDGGLVETSGKFLDFKGLVDTTAANGETGQLLLDPTLLKVVATLSGLPFTVTDGNLSLDFNASDVSEIDDDVLNTALTTNDVLLYAAADPLVGGVAAVNEAEGFAGLNLDSDGTSKIIVEAGTAVNTGTNTLFFSADEVDLYAAITGNVTGGSTWTGAPVDFNGTVAAQTPIDPMTVNVFNGAQIQDGVDIVRAGGTVNVGDGTYIGADGQATINKNLTLTGNLGDPAVPGAGSPLIQGDGTGTAISISGGATNVTVSGLHIDNWHRGVEANIGGGTTIPDTSVTVDNNTITNTVGHGVFIDEFADVNVTFNDIQVTDGDAVYVEDFSNTTANITDNIMYGNNGLGDGVHLRDVDNNDMMTGNVLRNDISGFTRGVYVQSANGDSNFTIEENFINENLTGIQVTNDAVAGNVKVFNNDLSGNTLAIDNLDVDGMLDASGNWFGTTDEASVVTMNNGSVDVSPYLGTGTDTDAGTLGFQGDFGDLYVTDDGAQTSGLIQEGIDLATAGGNVKVNDGTYTENITIDKSLKLTGLPNATLVAETAANLITVTASGVNIDPFTFNGAGMADYGVHATGAGADYLTVDGNLFKNFNEAGIYLANPTGTTTGDIKNNIFEGSSTRGLRTGTIGQDYTLNLYHNTVGSNGDEVLNGFLFGRIDQASINIMGGRIDSAAASANSADGDGIHFSQGLNNGASLFVRSINVHSDTDEAIDFQGGVDSGATVNIASGDFRGGNNGIEFSAIDGDVSIGTDGDKFQVTIDGQGADKRGINLLGSITGSLNVVKSKIYGTDDAIGSNNNQNNTVNGGTVSVTDSILAAENGDGVELGAVTNSSDITLDDNIVYAGANGFHFVNGIDDSTVSADGNTILAENHGILFGAGSPSVGNGSDVTLSNNDIYSENHGILFEDEVSGNSSVTITGGKIKLRDVSSTILRSNNNAYGISSSTLWPVASADGIKFAGLVNNANVRVSGVKIRATDNGIGFYDEVKGQSFITIAYNNIKAGLDGIVFKGKTSNADTSFPYSEEEILIKKNTIIGGQNGISFEAEASGDRHDITIRDNYKIVGENGHGIAHTGNIKGATLRIKDNKKVTGYNDGIHVEGYLYQDAKVDIDNNGQGHHGAGVKGITGNGISVQDYLAGGADVDVTDNHIHWSALNGVKITDVDGVLVDGNTIHNVGENGVYIDPSDDATVTGNTIYETGANGVLVEGGSGHYIGWNNIYDIARDGINVTDFGKAWIAHNWVSNTGDDGIEASNGFFVSIYGNDVEHAGFYDDDDFGGKKAMFYHPDYNPNDLDGEGANGILVMNVGGYGRLPSQSARLGRGHSYYGGYNIEIIDNDVAFAKDDGIEVDNRDPYYDGPIKDMFVVPGKDFVDVAVKKGYEDAEPYGSAIIAHNDVGHVDDDGILVENVGKSYLKWNGVSMTGDDGIDINGGYSTKVKWNRVMLAGDDGIDIENIGGEEFSAENFGFGPSMEYEWAVEVEGNEVAFTAENGIEVTDSGSTKIAGNDIIYAGMGDDLTDMIDYINGIASGAFIPAFNIQAQSFGGYGYPSFTWEWGQGDGIHTHNIYGYGPYGLSQLIDDNTVFMTGGDGIDTHDAGRTLIQRNDISYAGIDETRFGGFYSLAELLSDGPFDDESRETLWWNRDTWYPLAWQEPMNDIIRDYLPAPKKIKFDSRRHVDHDGIHAENIYADYFFNGYNGYFGAQAAYFGGGYGEGEKYTGQYGPLGEYSLVIFNNNVTKTADDGIEVVGQQGEWLYGTGRTLIANNDISHVGVKSEERVWNHGYMGGYNGGGYNSGINNVAFALDGYSGGYNGYWDTETRYGNGDHFGADAIHVRGVFDGNDTLLAGLSEDGFYGYDINVINNDIDTTSDDGIEVIHSGSAYIYYNDIYNIGTGSDGYGYRGYKGADWFGADAIHVRNVFGSNDLRARVLNDDVAEDYIEPWSVVVRDNYINHTQDDGVEVVHSGRTWVDGNEIYNVGVGSVSQPEEPDGPYQNYGGQNKDGYGADAIHVREVVDLGYRNRPADLIGPQSLEFGDIPQSNYVSVKVTGNKIGHDPERSVKPVTDLLPGEDMNGQIAGAADDGIQVLWSGDTIIDDNDIANVGVGEGRKLKDKWGGDGIHVLTGYFHKGLPEYDDYHGDRNRIQSAGWGYYNPYFLSTNVEITNNNVVNSADDGIEAEGVTNLLVDTNTVDESGHNGIKVTGYAGFFDQFFDDEEDMDEEYYRTVSLVSPDLEFGIDDILPNFEAVITNNTVTNSGTEEPEAPTDMYADELRIDGYFGGGHYGQQYGGNGIHIDNYDYSLVQDNTVTNSVENALYVSGPFNGETQVFGNTFDIYDVGAHFESGLIDLVNGDGNNFLGGNIDLLFKPFDFGDEDAKLTTSREVRKWPYFRYPETPEDGFAQMSLIDDDTSALGANFGGSIGAQFFNGESPLFIVLDNEAFWSPGFPTLLNAWNSTFVLPSYNGTPSALFPTGNPDAQFLTEIDQRIIDFADGFDLGLFFFGTPQLITIAQEDIFNLFDPLNLEEGGFSATITGPVNIPGAPQNFANITPFAGGEDGEGGDVTPESLNAIETAAGQGQNSTCWADAVNVAGSGTVSNISAETSFESRVNSAINCANGVTSN